MRRALIAIGFAAAPVEAGAEGVGARFLLIPPAGSLEAVEPPPGPLHEAAALGDAALVAALVRAGADPGARDATGRTPLHLAQDAGVAAVLALAGADPCATDAQGRRALRLGALSAMRTAAPAAYALLLPCVAACR